MTPLNPAVDPGGFLSQLLQFAHTSWPLAVMLGLYGILEVSVKLGRSVPALAVLDRGRTTLVTSGAIAVLGAVLDALMNGGQVQSALMAGVAALLAFWHPAMPTQPKVVA